MSTDGYLPEAAVNVDPTGGERSEFADRETAASMSDSGLPPNTPDGADATADAPGTVEGDHPGQNADPDLITDDDIDGGNS